MSVQNAEALKPNQTKPWQFRCQARTECGTEIYTVVGKLHMGD